MKIKSKRYSLMFVAIMCNLMLQHYNLFGQVYNFQKVFGGYTYDQGNDLIQNPDSSYYLLCSSGSFSSSSDIYLMKVDKFGSFQWQHTYGGSEIEGGVDIEFTNDGKIIMLGNTSSIINKSYDFYLVKSDLNGNLIWSNNYGSADWEFSNSMDSCSDGGYILAGITYNTGNAYSDILLVKTDSLGNELWQKKFGGNLDDVANKIISISDGYLICGTTESIGAGKKDIYVFKIDLNGNLIWEKTLGGAEDDTGESLLLDTLANELIVGGNTKSYGISQYYNFYLQKLDLNGNLLPSNFISTNNSNYYLKKIIYKQNGNIMVCGDVDNVGATDFMLLEYDNGLNFVIGTTYGGFNVEKAYGIVATSDGGICAIGSTTSFGSGMDNIYLVKCDTMVTNVGSLQNYVSIKEPEKIIESSFLVFPNPVSENLLFTIENCALENNSISNSVQLLIHNYSGQLIKVDSPVFVSKDCTLNTSMNVSELPAGFYYCSFCINGQIIESDSFSVVK